MNKTLGVLFGMLGIILIAALLFHSGCCSALNPPPEMSDMDKLKFRLTQAQGVLDIVGENLPLIQEQAEALCKKPAGAPADWEQPDWCLEVPTAMQDARDALFALQALVDETIAILDMGKEPDIAVLTQNIISGIIKLTAAYIRIQAIVNRH